MNTFIIGEAGSNHENSLNRAKRLIDLAYDSGCDAVKFQFCSNYARFVARRKIPLPKYRFSIEREWLPTLSAYCSDGDQIEFMCSTYLPEDIEVVAPFVKRFKVSAFEQNDKEFIDAHFKFDKPVIISGETLYCVSKYPCPDDDIHLWKVAKHKGLSDHTKNPLTGALAVALNAEIIETHFRLEDTSRDCPDFAVSRSPEELKLYVQYIRQAEVLLE